MKKVIFIGSKELGFSVFKKLHTLDKESLQGCITLNDQNDSRSAYKQFVQYCKSNGIRLYILDKSKEMNRIVYEIKPDLCFVVGWYFLIDTQVINSVPMGFIGIHNSLLPQYRGFAPLVWAMINGEKKTGFSLFNFSEELDAGEIWATGEVSIEDTDYIGDLIKKIEEKILEVLNDKYLMILNCKIRPYNQQKLTPSYCARRLPEDGMIDWHFPAEKIYNFIRAQSHPYPGAYTFYKQKRLIIWRAELYANIYYGTPGQIGQILKDGRVLIICGDSRGVILQEVEYEDRVVKAVDVLNSLTIRL